MSEIRVASASGDDEIVVCDVALRGLNGPAIDVESGYLRHQDLDVFVGTQNGANWCGNLSRRKAGRCDLIQKRLERVIVPAVDDGDFDRSFAQALSGIQAAEAGTYNYDPRNRLVVHLAVLCRTYIRFTAMADSSISSSAEGVTPAWVRVAMPSVADLIFVALLCVLVFTPLSVRLLGDAGIGWHIRTGQQILATHAVPRVDSFSSTMAGKPWFAWEWLYDLAVGELGASLGLNGVVWFTAIVIAAAFAGMFRFLIGRGTNILPAVVALLLAVCASMIHFLARPHVVSWLLTLAWFWILDSHERRGRAKTGLALASAHAALG